MALRHLRCFAARPQLIIAEVIQPMENLAPETKDFLEHMKTAASAG